MYLAEFGLHIRPFALGPDARLIVWTPGLGKLRREILAAIAEREPLIVLTAGIGAGKTTFLSAICAEGLSPGTHVVFLRGQIADAEETLEFVAAKLPKSDAGGPADRIAAVAARGPILVILDEAQAAAPGAVQALVGLSQGDGHLSVLLAGQPELRDILKGEAYRGLRVSPRHTHEIALPDAAEAQDYIRSRIEMAGGAGDLIQPEARVLIADRAGRVPRRINKIADACLYVAATENRADVDAAFARRVIDRDLDPMTFAFSPGGKATPAPANAEAKAGDVIDDDTDPATVRDPLTENPARPARRILPFAGAALLAILAAILLAPSMRDRNTPVADVAAPAPQRSVTSAPATTSPVALEAAPPDPDAAQRLFARALEENDSRLSAIDYARAAVLGHARAAVYAGQKYDGGDGVLYSPQMAAHWYAATEGQRTDTGAEPTVPPVPLFGARDAGRIDMVWEGIADGFDIELGDAEGLTIGTLRTSLTAASVQDITDAALWRVRATGGAFTDWTPISPAG